MRNPLEILSDLAEMQHRTINDGFDSPDDWEALWEEAREAAKPRLEWKKGTVGVYSLNSLRMFTVIQEHGQFCLLYSTDRLCYPTLDAAKAAAELIALALPEAE